MKLKLFALPIMIFLVMLSFSLVSAMASLPVNNGEDKNTGIGGIIYNEDYTLKISGAFVIIDCDENIKNATSDLNGWYYVEFTSQECPLGSNVSVNATKNELSGSKSGEVSEFLLPIVLDVNLAVVNIPIVPEFGVIVGLITLLGAVGIFFVVRK